MESELAPMIAKGHALPLASAEFLIQGRAYLAVLVACNQPSIQVLAEYIKSHDSAKPNIWPVREAVLPPADKLTPVNVGIWDSGFDTSLFPDRLFTQNPTGTDDAHGVAFDVLMHTTHGELIPLTPQQARDYPSMVEQMQAMGDIEGHVDSPAAAAFRQRMSKLPPAEVRKFFDEMSIVDGYAHGTHVAGIAAAGNPAIRLAYARMTYDNGNPHMPPTDALLNDTASSYAATVQWLRDHKIRVVNMSWWDRPSAYEKDLTDNGIGKDEAERKRLARHYFEIERDALYTALKSAPEILFVTIAGNSNSNNAFEEDIPSSFRLPNLIVTGAVDEAGEETSFTTYGDNVLVDADGASVESAIPGGANVKMSGTSMAAPQVTNLAAKLLAIDPALTPVELIELIRKGSDASADGRRHLINPRRTVDLLEKQKMSAK
jgi:subtilisin family serine protease